MPTQVSLSGYDIRWQQEFRQTRSCILHACEGYITQVAHIGSTAVKDMPARPVIDVMVAAPQAEYVPQAIPYLLGLNYKEVLPVQEEEGVRVFRRRRGPFECMVYLMDRVSSVWQRNIAFRDWLRGHPDDAARYANLKRRLALVSCDIAAYDVGKVPFQRHLEDQALAAIAEAE